VISDSQILATSPAGSGTVDVTVTTPGGTTTTSSSDQFTYISHSIISTVSNALSAAANVLSQLDRTATLQTGSVAVSLDAATPGTLNVNIISLQDVHVARVLRKGTVLARGKVVARHAGKVKLKLRLTAAGRSALKSLIKALPVQLTANFISTKVIKYTTKLGTRIRPRHHAGGIRGSILRGFPRVAVDV
jgi:hypothetical protein